MKAQTIKLETNKQRSNWKPLHLLEKNKKQIIEFHSVFEIYFQKDLNANNYRNTLRKPVDAILKSFANGTTSKDKLETLAEIKKLENLLLASGGFKWTFAKEQISIISAIK